MTATQTSPPRASRLIDPEILARDYLAIAVEPSVAAALTEGVLPTLGSTLAALSVSERRRRLAVAAAAFRLLRGRLETMPNGDPDVLRLRREAARALLRGDLAGTDRLLAEAEFRDLSALTGEISRDRPRRLSAVETRGDRAELALMRGDKSGCREASRLLAEAAAIARPADPKRAHVSALGSGDALIKLAERFDDGGALRQALDHFRALAATIQRTEQPAAFASTQGRLGDVLVRLGLEDDDVLRFRQAAAAYRAALEETSREADANGWAALQIRLGQAQHRVGAQGSGTTALAQAVTHLRSGLAALRAEAEPELWTEGQHELAGALAMIGARESGTAELEQAVDACRRALDACDRAASPRLWSQIQHDLGAILARLGERYTEPVILEDAVGAFRAALEEREREHLPLLWATTLANQGSVMLTLAERGRDPALAAAAARDLMTASDALRGLGLSANAAVFEAKLVRAGELMERLARD